jgi:hypothetical protein
VLLTKQMETSLSAAEFTAVKKTADTADALATENEGYFTTLHALIGPIFGDGDGTYTDMSAISADELNLLDGVAAYDGIVAITGNATYELNTAQELEDAVSGGAYMSDILAATDAANARSILSLTIGTDIPDLSAVTDNDTRIDTIEGQTGIVFSDNDGTYTDMSAISSTELGYLDGVAGAIWHANNDGSGSGLDADTVDGYNAVRIIASGTAALGTSEIASGACATVVTETASGVATTDVVNWGFNADVTSTTGYNPSTGVLVIYAYPTANNVNFKVCNLTDGAITPAAVTLNWDVMR